jgi:alanine dehydrogenase
MLRSFPIYLTCGVTLKIAGKAQFTFAPYLNTRRLKSKNRCPVRLSFVWRYTIYSHKVRMHLTPVIVAIPPNQPQAKYGESSMLVLSRRDVELLLTMPEAIDAVEEGFRQYALGHVTMPQRLATPVQPHNGLHLSMPAFVGGEGDNPGTLSIKIVTVFGDNPSRYGEPTIQGVVLLHDAATGRPLALMDAEQLTAMRTGAAGGVATNYLARENATVATIFGSGVQAVTQLQAVCAVRGIQRAFVYSLNAAGDLQYAQQMTAQLGIPVVRAPDARTAVEAAHVICTATNSPQPLFDGAWLQPGVHINAIGAYTRTMRELDTTAIQRSRVFVDGRQAAQTEAGDIVIPMSEGAITPDHIRGELGEVICGRVPGRLDPTDITIFKSVGMAVQDAVAAAAIYAQARAQGVGREIEL